MGRRANRLFFVFGVIATLISGRSYAIGSNAKTSAMADCASKVSDLGLNRSPISRAQFRLKGFQRILFEGSQVMVLNRLRRRIEPMRLPREELETLEARLVDGAVKLMIEAIGREPALAPEGVEYSAQLRRIASSTMNALRLDDLEWKYWAPALAILDYDSPDPRQRIHDRVAPRLVNRAIELAVLHFDDQLSREIFVAVYTARLKPAYEQILWNEASKKIQPTDASRLDAQEKSLVRKVNDLGAGNIEILSKVIPEISKTITMLSKSDAISNREGLEFLLPVRGIELTLNEINRSDRGLGTDPRVDASDLIGRIRIELQTTAQKFSDQSAPINLSDAGVTKGMTSDQVRIYQLFQPQIHRYILDRRLASLGAEPIDKLMDRIAPRISEFISNLSTTEAAQMSPEQRTLVLGRWLRTLDPTIRPSREEADVDSRLVSKAKVIFGAVLSQRQEALDAFMPNLVRYGLKMAWADSLDFESARKALDLLIKRSRKVGNRADPFVDALEKVNSADGAAILEGVKPFLFLTEKRYETERTKIFDDLRLRILPQQVPAFDRALRKLNEIEIKYYSDRRLHKGEALTTEQIDQNILDDLSRAVKPLEDALDIELANGIRAGTSEERTAQTNRITSYILRGFRSEPVDEPKVAVPEDIPVKRVLKQEAPQAAKKLPSPSKKTLESTISRVMDSIGNEIEDSRSTEDEVELTSAVIFNDIHDLSWAKNESKRVRDQLEQYVHDISKYPLLSGEEEKEKFVRLVAMRAEGSVDSDQYKALRNELIQSNLGLAFLVAKKYRGSMHEFSDLIGTATLGIVNAVDGFDPARGYKFSTYAYDSAKNEILKMKSSIGRPFSVNLSRAGEAASILSVIGEERTRTGHSPDVTEVLEGVNLSLGRARGSLKLMRPGTSLSQTVESSGHGNKQRDQTAFIPDPNAVPPDAGIMKEDKAAQFEMLEGYIQMLPLDQRAAVNLVFGIGGREPVSVVKAAEILGITRQAVDARLQRAMKQLREIMNEDGVDSRDFTFGQ